MGAVRSTQPTQLATVNEAAKYWRVCRKTIYNWIAEGKIKTRRTPGGHLRLVLEDTDATWRDQQILARLLK